MDIIKKTLKLLKRMKKDNTPKEEEVREGTMWDFRVRFSGHALEFGIPKDNYTRDVSGWHLPRIKQYDTFLYKVIMHTGEIGVGVYIFISIRYENDSNDLFFGKVGLLRYATEEDIQKLKKRPGGFLI